MEIMKDKVWLVINVGITKDDIVSIGTTAELARSAVLFHTARRQDNVYIIKEWQLNVTRAQWD
jgi:hypothetical protein